MPVITNELNPVFTDIKFNRGMRDLTSTGEEKDTHPQNLKRKDEGRVPHHRQTIEDRRFRG